MHISTANISQMVTDRVSIVITDTGSCMCPFDGHIYIWPWPILKDKVMNFSTANFSKIMTDKSNITIVIKYDVTCGLSISIFRFDLGLFWRSTWYDAKCFSLLVDSQTLLAGRIRCFGMEAELRFWHTKETPPKIKKPLNIVQMQKYSDFVNITFSSNVTLWTLNSAKSSNTVG